MSRKPILEDMLAKQIWVNELPEPKRHYQFHPVRRWETDFCWPEQKLIVEVEGGTWVNGRHVQPIGFAKDCEKYNTATIMGYSVLRFVGKMIEDGTAIQFIKVALGATSNDSSDKGQLDLPVLRKPRGRRSRSSTT